MLNGQCLNELTDWISRLWLQVLLWMLGIRCITGKNLKYAGYCITSTRLDEIAT